MPLPGSAVLRIKALPEGDAPEWVRRAWIGVRIALPAYCARATEHRGFGATSAAVRTQRAYSVPLFCAAEALRLHGRHDAARWWLRQPFAVDALSKELLFHPACIQVERRDPGQVAVVLEDQS
jgi:hypothetical protein